MEPVSRVECKYIDSVHIILIHLICNTHFSLVARFRVCDIKNNKVHLYATSSAT